MQPLPIVIPTVAPPSVSLAVAVVTLLSLLAGGANIAVQSSATPKTWLPWLVGLGSFLGGFVSYEASQPAVTLASGVLFYAAVTGLLDVLAALTPGLAVHALHAVPSQLAAVRRARLAAKSNAAPAPVAAPAPPAPPAPPQPPAA